MEEDELINNWTNLTMAWTQGGPSCSIEDVCLRVMNQAKDDVSSEDISE